MIEDLKERIYLQYGNDIDLDIFGNKRYTTFRVNTLKSSNLEIEEVLISNEIDYEKVSWSDNAYIVKNIDEVYLRKMDIYNEGKIYLQSLSSQIPPIILEPKEKELILDMAAAPGGKTSQIAALTNNMAMITAIEINKKRFERLKYNLDKLGVKKTTILNINARNLDNYFLFDKILLDAPCSGSGTISDNEGFDITLVDDLVEKQKMLLEVAINHLKVNGELVYSTCSILKEENEDVLKFILNKYDLEIIPLDDKLKDILTLKTSIPGTIIVAPNKYYEGFFVAKLKKKS